MILDVQLLGMKFVFDKLRVIFGSTDGVFEKRPARWGEGGQECRARRAITALGGTLWRDPNESPW